MVRQFNLLQLFSLVDGRLSITGMDAIYDMLGHICRFPGIMTHHLPVANTYVQTVLKPSWFAQVETELNEIKAKVGDDFDTLMRHIQYNQNTVYDIPQMPEENEAAFGTYMVENSLLNNIGKNR